MTDPLLPARLRPGDTIAVFHPAGPIRDYARFEKGLHILRDFGLRVRHDTPRGNGPEYLAAADEDRVRELHTLWADKEVKALIAARGGYGCLRIISALDMQYIRAHPKWLIGFSDLTVLLNSMTTRSGLVTLHGPVVSSLARMEPSSIVSFKEQLAGIFHPCQHIPGLEILRPGIGRGRLIGGNLTTVAHLLGTPWQPQFDGALLFLEDTAEPLYKLDRMLTQLACSGLLAHLSGLLLGTFDPGHDDRLEILRLNEQVWNRILELTNGTNYPIWGGFPVGHQRHNLPLPIGMAAVMDSSSGLLEFQPKNCRCTHD